MAPEAELAPSDGCDAAPLKSACREFAAVD